MSITASQRADLVRVLSRWEESLTAWRAGGSDRDRDSAILRFELTYEVAWKHLQTLVREQGFESNGPRQAFEHAYRLGWIDDEVVFAEILQARNRAVQVYREEAAQELGLALPEFQAAFARLLTRLPPVSAAD